MEAGAAAGIALAVLPLVITIIEDYKAAIHPFLMLKHYQREARQFRERLKTQQTVFVNETQHLLHSITKDGDEMISDPSHHRWQDKELDQKLRTYLSNSLDSCISTIQLIKEILDEVREDTYDGFYELQKSKEEKGASQRIRIVQKFKLAFSYKDLHAKVDMLRQYNGDLHVLRQQVENLEKQRITVLPQRRNPAKSTAPHRTMRKVSQTLYDTLSQVWSCPQHLEHSPNICLDESPNRVTSEKVCFDMVFTFSRPLKSIAMDTIPITIESMLEQSDVITDSRPPQGGEVSEATAESQNQERGGKTVNFALPATAKPALPESALLDLCSVQDMCVYVQNSLHNPAAASPIGYLQKNKTYKHFIFPPKTYRLYTGSIMSLSDTLRAAQAANGMSLPEKLRLAKLFALAVLQFTQLHGWMKIGGVKIFSFLA